MELALYKGPADDWKHKVAHWLVCTLTWSKYSHIELVIRGICYTSSFRDHGVRTKKIDLLNGHWDIYPIEANESIALAWFDKHKGEPYDWIGMLRVCPLLRWLPKRNKTSFCSEAVGGMLGFRDPERFSPEKVLWHYFHKHW